MASDAETRVLINAGALWAHFSDRIARLPKPLQDVFFEDVETAVEHRLKVLEAAK
jgi:hypothetical protein